MKKLLAALCVCVALNLTACTASDDEEKGSIEQFTDEIAHDATDSIQSPLNKARGVQNIARQRNEELTLEDEAEEEEW